MRSDIDRLMTGYNLDALIIFGDKAPNAYRDYLTKRAKFGGLVIKKRSEEPIIIASGMEIGEAGKSGLKVYTSYDFDSNELYNLAPYFQKLNISGRVAFYGVADVANVLKRIADLKSAVPGIEIAIDTDVANLFNKAYETKDAEEIACLKEAGRLTNQVVRDTWEFISQHRAEGTTVVNTNGQPLTIGAVKRFIRLRELELGLDDSEGCIFAQGKDAGLPHSHGEDGDVLQLGQSIVFDIFPRSADSGYFHDMTRTWCIGYAPPDVQAAYDEVMGVFNMMEDMFKVGDLSSNYQLATLDYFEGKGHPTSRSKPGTIDGYVHGLGHGLGLNIHEMPHFSHLRPGSPLLPGMVFTVEPGLYYPDRGFGVRVEDTVYFDQEGALHTLTDFPYDLVLPLKG